MTSIVLAKQSIDYNMKKVELEQSIKKQSLFQRMKRNMEIDNQDRDISDFEVRQAVIAFKKKKGSSSF